MRVGITGGIGTGKTTVCQIFEQLGIPVYYADAEAKRLMSTDRALKSQITKLFGKEAYLPDGQLNRALIASIVFDDKSKLDALNASVHGRVEAHSRAWHAEQMANGAPYTLREAALIVESGGYRHLDKLIVVTAPLTLRLKRVAARDGLTYSEIRKRMKNQLPEKAKLALADFIVANNGKKALSRQVLAIHQALLEAKTMAENLD